MIIFLRILFIVISMLLSSLYFVDKAFYVIMAAAAVSGVVALLVLILIEYVLHTFSARMFAAAIIGLIIGFTLGHLLNLAYGALNIHGPGRVFAHHHAAHLPPVRLFRDDVFRHQLRGDIVPG